MQINDAILERAATMAIEDSDIKDDGGLITRDDFINTLNSLMEPATMSDIHSLHQRIRLVEQNIEYGQA